MKHPLLILISASIATVVFVGWRMRAMSSHIVNEFVEVYDPSLSFAGGCESLVGSAEAAFHNPGVSEKSTLTILVLGDDLTAHEPRRLAAYAIPANHKVIEGKRANARRQGILLQDLWTHCGSIPPTTVSPIFLGVKEAIADLRAEGCKRGSQCGLLVNSDLEENGTRAIEERINGLRHAREPLPLPLDNDGIEVTFCGFAQTLGRIVNPSGREILRSVTHDPHRDDRLQDVWRALFTMPEFVTFEPYCPEPSGPRRRDGTVGRPAGPEADLN